MGIPNSRSTHLSIAPVRPLKNFSFIKASIRPISSPREHQSACRLLAHTRGPPALEINARHPREVNLMVSRCLILRHGLPNLLGRDVGSMNPPPFERDYIAAVKGSSPISFRLLHLSAGKARVFWTRQQAKQNPVWVAPAESKCCNSQGWARFLGMLLIKRPPLNGIGGYANWRLHVRL